MIFISINKPSFSIKTLSQVKNDQISDFKQTGKAQIIKARINKALEMRKQSENWSNIDVS